MTLKEEEVSGFFKKQYFELLGKYGNEIRDKSDQEQNEAYEILQQANDLTKNWAEALITRRFEQGHLGGFTNRPTNQGNKFKHYTWAKIYPRKNAPKQLAFTVGIDTHVGFIVKIDTVGDIGIKRNKYELLRGNFDDDSPIIAFLPIDDGLSKNLDELVAWSIEEIKQFGITYDNLCAELELDDENDASDFTAQLALNFLKNRYVKSEQKTKKIFLCINNLGKELALETGNLSTTTVRVFIQEQPPENIIEAGQCKFIPRNAEKQSPNSNLNTNTTTLRSEDDFYQISPKSKVELLQLCNWLDKIDDIFQLSESGIKFKGSQKVDNALNRILFGAAGTGKTYSTINHALAILEEEDLTVIKNQEEQPNGRKKLKDRFDKFKNEGRIKFVTFHQSFSYEDFVEGIRAETNEGGHLIYDVKPGVFKEICEDAQIEIYAKQNNVSAPIEVSINFAIDQLITRAKIEEIIFHTKRGAEIKVSSNSAGNLFALTSTGSNVPLSIRHIRNYLKIQNDMIVDQKSYEWAIAKALRSEVEFASSVEKVKPYVLIIDEINRGNISRIFGELITLIEDSKRKNAKEELSVTLPYSKKEFSVPNNVYIIGTMNSSDSSLTGLDIALRRRFTFIEMPPQPDLLDDISVDGLNICELLKVINQRIEVLLDRDHCIGHANFMVLKEQPTLENLAYIFKQKIIPQLQEYFFDDWAKINLVLNDNGMLKPKPVEKSAIFPNVDSDDLGYFENKKTWELIPTSFKLIESFAKIIQH